MKKLLTFVFLLGSAFMTLTSCNRTPTSQCGYADSVCVDTCIMEAAVECEYASDSVINESSESLNQNENTSNTPVTPDNSTSNQSSSNDTKVNIPSADDNGSVSAACDECHTTSGVRSYSINGMTVYLCSRCKHNMDVMLNQTQQVLDQMSSYY